MFNTFLLLLRNKQYSKVCPFNLHCSDFISQRIWYVTTPRVKRGPFLVKHCAEVENYTPGFVVDPLGDDVQHNPPENPDEIAFVVRISK